MDRQIPKGQYFELNINEIILPDSYDFLQGDRQMDLPGLAESLESVGQLQAIIVSKADDKYYAVCGRRRIEAAKQAHMTKIEAKVYENLDQRIFLLMLGIENIQRRDFNVIQKAKYFRMLEDEKFTVKAIADKMNMDINTVRRYTNLLELPDDIQQMMTRKDKPLPVHQALMLHKKPQALQREAARLIAPVTGPIANEEAAKEIIAKLEEDKLNEETKKLDLRPGLPIPRGAKPPKLKTGKRPTHTIPPTKDQRKNVPARPSVDNNGGRGFADRRAASRGGRDIVSLGEINWDVTGKASLDTKANCIRLTDSTALVKIGKKEIVLNGATTLMLTDEEKVKIIAALKTTGKT